MNLIFIIYIAFFFFLWNAAAEDGSQRQGKIAPSAHIWTY